MKKIVIIILNIFLMLSSGINVFALTNENVEDTNDSYVTNANKDGFGILQDDTNIELVGDCLLSDDVKVAIKPISSKDDLLKDNDLDSNAYVLLVEVYKDNKRITLDNKLILTFKVPDGYENMDFYRYDSKLNKLSSNVFNGQMVSSNVYSSMYLIIGKKHQCNYSSTYSSDDTYHFKQCSCGKKSNVEKHSKSAWIIDRLPTSNRSGSKHIECTVCKRVLDTSIITYSSDKVGMVSSVIKQIDKDVVAQINSSNDELISITFDNDEQLRIIEGSNAKVFLNVDSKHLDKDDTALIKDNLEVNNLGVCFELSLFKQLGDNPMKEICEINKNMNISIKVPKNIVSDMRTYKIIRVHEGVISYIDGNFDKKSGLFTFETNQFSTFALVYNDNQKTSLGVATADGDYLENYVVGLLISGYFLFASKKYKKVVK